MKYEFTVTAPDMGTQYIMAYNNIPALAPAEMPSTEHIGDEGPLLIVTGEFDDDFLKGRVNAYYSGPDDWDYLVQEITYDVQNIMWFQLQNPPSTDPDYAGLSEEQQLLKWRNECHTYDELGFTSEFTNDEYEGMLNFKTSSTFGTTGEIDEPFAGMIVGFMKEHLKQTIEQQETELDNTNTNAEEKPPTFVVLPSRERLTKMLNEAAGCEIAKQVLNILDAYPNQMALHQITGVGIATRDQVVRKLLRRITIPETDFQPVTKTQVEAIEAVLLRYYLIWTEKQWSVNQALQLHLQNVQPPQTA